MEKSKIFIRGQVWYWNDPIYGSKELEMNVNIGEVAMRYNRYVIIAQTTDSINNSNVLVVPCSSSNKDPDNVQIPIQHNVLLNCYTNAVPRKIFPVHSAALTNYVCQIPEDCMKRIEANLVKILCPSITNSLSDLELKELCALDMHVENNSVEKVSPKGLSDIKNFIKKCIRLQSHPDTPISIFTIKNAFDKYCKKNHLDGITDIIEFISYFTYCMHMDVSKYIRNFDLKKISFDSFYLIDCDQKTFPKRNDSSKKDLEKNENHSSNQQIPKKSSNQKWTDIKKLEFLRYLEKHGTEKTMKKYNFTQKTIHNYTAKWRKYFNERGINYKEYEGDIPKDISDIKFTVSSFANILGVDLLAINTKQIQSDPRLKNISDLDTILSGTIYHSILDMLHIKNHERNNEGIPKISNSTNNIHDFIFFDNFKKAKLNGCRSWTEICHKYMEVYDCTPTLRNQWIQSTIVKLSKKLNVHSDVIKLWFDNYSN